MLSPRRAAEFGGGAPQLALGARASLALRMARIRADQLLVQRGLVESRELAQRMIMAGRARVGTLVLIKAATMLADDCAIELTQAERFVGRGGHKLQAALDHFQIDVTGRRALDIGASTGGFTDCLLQAGAASVLAVDVGRAQLHQRLRDDPRVTLLEKTNARDLPPLPPGIELFVADVSFISLRKVLPSVAGRLAPGTNGIVLFKPQFEAGPVDVPRGGVIRDGVLRARLMAEFLGWLAENGWTCHGSLESPVHGSDGNIETLVYLATPGGPSPC